jgi:hypothetical protein
MKLHPKIFGIGLLTAVIVPHLYEKGYKRRYRELFVDRCWQWWHGRIPSIQSGRLGRVLGRAINCVGRFLA